MAQRYKFESKSQLLALLLPRLIAVSCGSKVQIWKQITTIVLRYLHRRQLFPVAQRYKFESKSQRRGTIPEAKISCFLWLKGTNLKANHNSFFADEEISMLFPVAQRYKFESKSQPTRKEGATSYAVSCGSKVQIWKQITTMVNCSLLRMWLFPVAQRYKFESKSQPNAPTLSEDFSCFLWLKGTNLKANHNFRSLLFSRPIAVSCGSKVQIWKQITTLLPRWLKWLKLFPVAQRYKFESKSQPSGIRLETNASCFLWLKGTNLKANHNYVCRSGLCDWAVSCGSKVQIWKQITTRNHRSQEWQWLFPVAQRYKFESKSQRSVNSFQRWLGCFLWLKGTNLKANHNYIRTIKS